MGYGLDLMVYKNQEAVEKNISPKKGKFECCTELKTNALKKVLSDRRFKALYLGIRRPRRSLADVIDLNFFHPLPKFANASGVWN